MARCENIKRGNNGIGSGYNILYYWNSNSKKGRRIIMARAYISVESVRVFANEGMAEIEGFDPAELIAEVGAREILENIDYSDIMEYITELQKEDAVDE